MPSPEYDLRYLQAAVPLLQDYLLSNDLYWEVGTSAPAGERPYPQLTLGAVLLAQKRAQALAGSGASQAELAEVDRQIDALYQHWRVAWAKKAAANFRERLTLWRNFIEEYRDSAHMNHDRYPYEVERRVQLELLQPYAEPLPTAEAQLIAGLDKFLHAELAPGGFVWDPALEPSFPANPYWYLYGRLKRS